MTFKTGDRVRILPKKLYATVLVQREETLLLRIDKQRYTDADFYTEIPTDSCIIVGKSYVKLESTNLKNTPYR